MKDTHHISVLEFSKIDKNIFLGNNMCCQTHFDNKLLKKGVNADISLELDRLDSPQGVKHFLWLPTKDKTAPTITTLKAGTAFMHAIISEEDKVYVHCKNGHGRGPTLVLAYLITRGLSYTQAFALVKKKRSVIHLQSSQIKILKKFEKICE